MLDDIVRRNALRFPRKPALIGETRRSSWVELDQRVGRLTQALAAQGLARGDRVAILLGNCPEYLELYFACSRGGYIAVPLNYRLTLAEARTVLAHADPRLLVAGEAYATRAAELCHALPAIRHRWTVGGAGDAPSYETLIAAAPVDLAVPPSAPSAAAAAPQSASPPAHSPASSTPFPGAPAAQPSDADTFAIFFTSGTTGLPKGAMVSHANLLANGFNQMIADGSRADDINLIGTPLYHMGAVFMAVTYMMLGCTQVILPQFTPLAWLAALAAHRASVALLIPTMINSLLNEPRFGSFDRASLRLIFYGGGPMPPAVLQRALQRFDCGFTQGYGLTETLEATFLVASDHVREGTETQRRRLMSAGREAVDAEVRIVDDAGQDVATGVVGEVWVKSRSVIAGYWRQPELLATTKRGEWFCTGDLGYLDEDRYLFVVDRKSDMVVTGGVNVYTKEIEAVLYQHEAVREAAVFGMPDEQWGEKVTAAVSAHPQAQVTEDELIAWCRARLAGFKTPKQIVFLDELPKNPSGKILKRELKRHGGSA